MHPEDTSGFSLIGHSDLNGYGDGMQVMPNGEALYVGHFGPSGMGTSVLDISDPSHPTVVRQWPAPPGSHTHKVQVADGILIVNHELFRSEGPAPVGMALYDLADPLEPRQIGFFDTGGRGIHRIVYEGGKFAYVSVTPDGYTGRIWMIVDVSDPEGPAEVGRWWWPGMWEAGGEVPDWPEAEDRIAHHAMVWGDRAYLGMWDSGMVILDISDPAAPTSISHLGWKEGGHTHTCLPMPTGTWSSSPTRRSRKAAKGPPTWSASSTSRRRRRHTSAPSALCRRATSVTGGCASEPTVSTRTGPGATAARISSSSPTSTPG